MTANTNPLSYNAYIQQMGVLAVYQVVETAGVYAFVDAPITLSIPAMLNYAELRIQRDLDMLAAKQTKLYTMVALQNTFALPIDDFLTIELIKLVETSVANPALRKPLVPVSVEFIGNMYGGTSTPGTPQYFSMFSNTFGDGGDTSLQIAFGPNPDFAYPFNVNGVSRMPSLYKNASAGNADTVYNYISAYYPDLLLLASMVYITMLQRNFGAVSDTPESGMTYEKQYQMLKISARAEEDRRKQMGSGWTAYSTPVSATPTR
jgi:hypothetical protein